MILFLFFKLGKIFNDTFSQKTTKKKATRPFLFLF